MAVVDLNSNDRVNADGLFQRYGTNEAQVRRGGQYAGMSDGGSHVAEVIVDLVAVSTAAAHGSGNQVIVADNLYIPNGALLEKVELTVMEVSAGATATIDVGLVDQDRSTEIDFDGLIVAGTTGWHTAAIGTTVTYSQGSTEHGALLGTVLTNTGLLTVEIDTADFTAGVIKLRLFYSIPLAADLVSP